MTEEVSGMLTVSLLQLLCKGIPEGIAYVVGMYALTGLKIDWKRLLFMSGCLIVVTYFIRLLPIRFGIHTMLILFTMILLFMIVTKTPIIRNVKAALIILAFLIISEMINLGFLQFLFGSQQVQKIMANDVQKTYYSIPSTLIFILITILVYYQLVGRKKDRSGKTGTQTS